MCCKSLSPGTWRFEIGLRTPLEHEVEQMQYFLPFSPHRSRKEILLMSLPPSQGGVLDPKTDAVYLTSLVTHARACGVSTSHKDTQTHMLTHAQTHIHMYMHTSSHRCTHSHKYTHTLTYILVAHIITHTYTHTLTHTHMHTHSRAHMHTYSYICSHKHSHAYSHMQICSCM